MMNFNRMLHDFVLEAMANDYESFECVVQQVLSWAGQRGITVTDSDVAGGIEWAIRKGYATAYLLSAQPPYSQPVAFSREHLHDLWFYVTRDGMQRVKDLEKQCTNGE